MLLFEVLLYLFTLYGQKKQYYALQTAPQGHLSKLNNIFFKFYIDGSFMHTTDNQL